MFSSEVFPEKIFLAGEGSLQATRTSSSEENPNFEQAFENHDFTLAKALYPSASSEIRIKSLLLALKQGDNQKHLQIVNLGIYFKAPVSQGRIET
jgi:hypothetical protein